MIPPKLLMYRRTHSDANLETLSETWRRKKSCGELFQNGYRVRQGHHRREDRAKHPHSVRSGLRILLNWGKSVVIRVQIYVLVMLMLKHLPSVSSFFFFFLNKLLVKHSEHLFVTQTGPHTHTQTRALWLTHIPRDQSSYVRRRGDRCPIVTQCNPNESWAQIHMDLL